MTKEERKEYYRRWYQAHRDQQLEAKKQWYQAHKNQRQEAMKQWYQAHNRNVVYKYIDLFDNSLAYVGSTSNPYNRLKRRLEKHSTTPFDKLYQKDPSRFRFEEVQEFPILAEARAYEKQLIEELNPKYNVQHNK